MALLQLEAPHHAHDLGVGVHAVLLAERAAGLLVVVALEVDAVVDQADRRPVPALGDQLLLDRVRHGDEVVDLRREAAELRLVLGGADARRVDGGDHPRPPVAGVAQRDRRLRAHDLGAVHVVVDDVRAHVGQVGGQGGGGDGVVGVVDDGDVDARALELADGAAGRERDDRHVVELAVQAADEVDHVLLGAAVGAGRHDLDHAHALRAGHRQVDHRGHARIVAMRRRHRCTVRLTSRRRIGSSIAPHSYLYASSPRRKSIRVRPRSRARRT